MCLLNTLVSAIAVIVIISTAAQSQTIHAKVVDPNQKPVAGAKITKGGSKDVVVTDALGEFTIEANEGTLLVISHPSYTSAELIVGKNDHKDLITIILDDTIPKSPDPYYCCTDAEHNESPHCGKDMQKLKNKFGCTGFRKD
jgi:hypothetical protein